MKVVTIGRSHDNDVRIDDPYVGKHHCQIVQHDNGMFTIVDMNSTNGTYVNGRRVFGEAQLQPYDSVTIGNTTLPWVEYFSPKTDSYALPIVLGCVGWVLLTSVLTLLFFRHGSAKAFAFKGEYPDAVVVNMVDEDGTPFTIEAIEGQICVWFEEGVPYKTAKQSIKALGGRIVAQIPENGYYLVEVPADKVQNFLKRITKENFVDWAYPNMISYSCAVYNYVLDTYYRDKRKKEDVVPHGYVVEHALQEYGSNIAFRHFNIGNENGVNMCTSYKLGDGCVNSEFFALDTISRLNNDGPIFINMSYGVPLPERKSDNKYYWREATFGEKTMYRITYYHNLKKIYENAKSLEGKDYILVIAAGNEGVKVLDSAIISYLRDRLSPKEKEFMDKHVLLVTAGETEERHKDYSNEMEEGRYDPWVTKVDVSDFKYNGKKQRGTSFAAPRAAGILSSVANEMNLTGAEVLKYTREATLNSPDHSLTYESLKKTVETDKHIISKTTIPKHPEPANNSAKQNNNSSTGSESKSSSSKQTSGMGSYDYSATISYSENLFKNKSIGRINLPNGDVINYQYVYECDFLPEYYMRYTLGNGADITSKYSVALVKALEATQGYVGTDEDGYIDMRISYMGFDPNSNNEMILLIRKK